MNGPRFPSPAVTTLPGAEPFPPEVAIALAARVAASSDRDPLEGHGRSWNAGPTSGTPPRPKYVNRLVLETSPYLLQHAHNPVNWFPWGGEAFDLALRLARPVLLSVGYSTCHWCHVMERESFEDEEIAELINRRFVAIKVDREERPDIDAVYMTAVQLMTGSGGWPMTVVMTPDRRPFFAGTYFPPRDGLRGSRLGFHTLLGRLADVFHDDPEGVASAVQEITALMMQISGPSRRAPFPGRDTVDKIVSALESSFDPRFGGFGGAPKFPRPAVYDLLTRYAERTGDETSKAMVVRSLDAMIRGGIFDQIGGGFHRYSTDAEWLVPHFEKMLYDNAQLASTLIEAYQLTNREGFARAARRTLDYVLREMTADDGAFFSATDADSEGEEGKYFVWTLSKIEEVLGEDARTAIAYYGVTERGNFDGGSILHRPVEDTVLAARLGMSVEELLRRVDALNSRLRAARSLRPPPLLDDKIITEWNGQMIYALARSAYALDDSRYLEGARRAARFVLSHLRTPEGRLLRTFRGGRARHDAVLEDYVFLIAGLLDLFAIDGEPGWLEAAVALEQELDAHFLDREHGGYYGTATDGEALLMRTKPLHDGAQPSGNAVAADNLLRLWLLTEDARYRQQASDLFAALASHLTDPWMESPRLAAALDRSYEDETELLVVWPDDHPNDEDRALLEVVRRRFLPSSALLIAKESRIEELGRIVPWAQHRRTIGGRATAYVCRSRACRQPTCDPKELSAQLDRRPPNARG